MPFQQPEFWPFYVLPPEQRTEVHQQIIGFFEAADLLGYRPRKYSETDFLAENETRRYGSLQYRGRERGTARWEVALGEGPAREQAFWTDFPHAAEAVLVWLRGGTAADVFAAVEGHVIRGRVILEPAADGAPAS